MVISTSNLVGIIDVGVDAWIIPTKFEVDMTINCRVTAFLSDLVTLTFDLEQLSYMAGHVANPATKFEDPTTIRS